MPTDFVKIFHRGYCVGHSIAVPSRHFLLVLFMKKGLTALLTAFTMVVAPLAFVSSALAQQDQINLRPRVSLNGRGCPSGSYDGVMNGNTLVITFNDFFASAERGRNTFSNCTLNVSLSIPSGFTVQPLTLSYTGFADVPRGGSASMNVTAGISNRIRTIDVNTFSAGFSSDFTRNIPLELQAVNACHRPVEDVLSVGTNLIARGVGIPSGSLTSVGIFSQRLALGEPVIRIQFAFVPC